MGQKTNSSSFDSFKVEVTVSPSNGEVESEVAKDISERSPKRIVASIVRKSVEQEKRTISCVAMVADEVDAHNEAFTAEAVEGAANDFLAEYNITKDIGIQHSGQRPDVDLIGSWFTESGGNFDELEVPPNSWVVKMKVNDDEIWESVKSGELTGVSIEGPVWGYEVKKEVKKSVDSESVDSGDGASAKIIYTKAKPRNMDLVDEGANLKFLVWKAKNKMEKQPEEQAPESPEIVETEATKSATKSAPPETDDSTPEVKADVTKAADAPEESEPDFVAQMSEALKAKRLTPARAQALLSLQAQINDFIADTGVEAEPEVAAEVSKEKAEPKVDFEKLAEVFGSEVSKAVAPLSDRLAQLEAIRGASSVLDSDEQPEVKKEKGSLFKGLF